MAVLALAIFFGCQDDSSDSGDSTNGAATETAAFRLTMIDAPVDDAEHVYMTVSKISVHPEDAGDTKGDEQEQNGGQSGADEPGYGSWIDLEIEPATYDLLELQNNAGVLLTDQELPVGDYNQIRLLLDCSDANAPTIVVGGESFALKIPSGCESGFKLPGHFTVVQDQETALIMDFDARKSITLTGSDQYILKPVVRIVQENQVGVISGLIVPAEARAAVYAFETGAYTGAGDDPFAEAVNSTIAAEDGSFAIAALPAGTYDLVVQVQGYVTDVYVAQVEVAAGQETPVGSITLIPEE